MSTRNRHVREDGQKAFAGRVSKWRRQWVASSEPKSKGLQFQRWVQTGEWQRPDGALSQAASLQTAVAAVRWRRRRRLRRVQSCSAVPLTKALPALHYPVQMNDRPSLPAPADPTSIR